MNDETILTKTREQIELCYENGIEPIQLTEVFHILSHYMNEADRTCGYELKDGNLVYHITSESITLCDTSSENKPVGTIRLE